MERLYDTAARGDVKAPRQFLENDPLLLERVSYTNPSNTPLHIAATKGNLPVVEEILKLNLHLAEELNSQQSSPLHVASARGHLGVAKRLADAAPDMCLSLDSQGRNPLHLAAIKGHIDLLKELVSRAPLAARERVGRGLTVLHLCVKHCKLEALKFLVNEVNELINAKNDDGDTILHMAVLGKKFEIVKYLVSVGAVDVNAVNDEGITALDVLIRSRIDRGDSEIEKSLKKAGGFGISGKKMKHSYSSSSTSLPPGRRESLTKSYPGWVDSKKSSLMVVASLIATMAFQIGVDPPPGVWKNNKSPAGSQGKLVSTIHLAPSPSPSLSSSSSPSDPYVENNVVFSSASLFEIPICTIFYSVNTTAFVASLSIILLLMSGLPIRHRIFMWILMSITWIAIVAIALCYVIVIRVRALPTDEVNSVAFVILFTAAVWIVLTTFLIITHTIRIIVRIIKCIRRAWKRMMRRRRSSGGSTKPAVP